MRVDEDRATVKGRSGQGYLTLQDYMILREGFKSVYDIGIMLGHGIWSRWYASFGP